MKRHQRFGVGQLSVRLNNVVVIKTLNNTPVGRDLAGPVEVADGYNILLILLPGELSLSLSCQSASIVDHLGVPNGELTLNDIREGCTKSFA